MSINSSLPCASAVARDSVAEEVKKIAAEFSTVAAGEIGEDHNVFNDLGFDSLDVVEFTMELEEHFDISVPDELGEQAKTIGQIVDGVMKLLTPRDGR
ncbi:MAG: acyl carrier protein [Planctomycetaceae bacterium]|nr:acyl carrier protein [Planctomycetaceae bacterium]